MAAILSGILPDDLVIDILACLPVKSLKRFRCVSKAWRDLIESPNFIATHNLKQTTLKNVFLRYNIIKFREPLLFTLKVVGDDDVFTLVDDAVFIPFPYENSHLSICGPCNGILCLCNFKRGTEYFALWNPATREYKILPWSVLEPPNLSNMYLGDYGFGFDHRTNDYKVLRFVRNGYSVVQPVRAELYSLKRDSWKVIPLMDMDMDVGIWWYSPYKIKTYKDGVYYWWVHNRGDDSQWILSFNMVDEVFEKVGLPTDFGFPKLLAFFNGQLSLVLRRDEGMEKYFDIWVMTQYGVAESLVRQLSIGPIAGVERPLGFWKNSRMFFNDEKGRLFCYNLDTKQKKCLQLFGKRDNYQRVVNYEESLVPINSVVKWN